MKSRPCNCCHFFSLSLSSLPLLALRKKKIYWELLKKNRRNENFLFQLVESSGYLPTLICLSGAAKKRGVICRWKGRREREEKKRRKRGDISAFLPVKRDTLQPVAKRGGEKRDRGKKSMITMINSREWARPFKISGSALLNKDAKERFGARATRIYGNKVAIDDRA